MASSRRCDRVLRLVVFGFAMTWSPQVAMFFAILGFFAINWREIRDEHRANSGRNP